MKIAVLVKLNSKTESVALCEDSSYLVHVRARPIDGQANARLIELLAEHFNVPKSSVVLASGAKSRRKIFHVH